MKEVKTGTKPSSKRTRMAGEKYMKVIGLTGGIGSGKSTVLNILKNDYNAIIMLADDIGKQTMIPGTETYNQMVAAFGTDILMPDGNIDTARLAGILMADENKLGIQNSIVHPYVIREIEDRLTCLRKNEREGQNVLAAIESAILFEAGCDRLCDEIWVVAVSKELRIERLMKDRGYSRERAEAFISRQMSDEQYIAGADKIIYNDGNMDELKKKVADLLIIS